MLYLDRAIGQFWKRLASIIAVKGGQSVQHDHLHCNNRIVSRQWTQAVLPLSPHHYNIHEYQT